MYPQGGGIFFKRNPPVQKTGLPFGGGEGYRYGGGVGSFRCAPVEGKTCTGKEGCLGAVTQPQPQSGKQAGTADLPYSMDMDTADTDGKRTSGLTGTDGDGYSIGMASV